jgi:8-oxo-dGTP pyrophosphatase MutT (NUDIX family)
MATSTIKEDIICSGALFFALDTQRFLYLQRTKHKTAGQWGLVGGMAEKGETPWNSLLREIDEEIGKTPAIKKVIPLELYTSNDEKFFFHTYIAVVENEFIPKLNEEHCGYAWCTSDSYPRPLHVGLRNTLQNKTNQIKLKTVVDIVNNI